MATAVGAGRAVGLGSAKASPRRAAQGPDLLPAARRPRPLRLLAKQLVHFFALLLPTEPSTPATTGPWMAMVTLRYGGSGQGRAIMTGQSAWCRSCRPTEPSGSR